MIEIDYEQLESEVKKVLKSSANPRINGEVRSALVRDHWEKFCRECKFPHPKGEFVKLEDLFDLLFEENNSPRFLMHNFTTTDLPIRMLQAGKTLHYADKPEDGVEAERCSSFSLHGCGLGLYFTWGLFNDYSRSTSNRVGTSRGFIIFNDQFHEKICSRDSISLDELNVIKEILGRVYKLNEDDFRLFGQIITSVNGKPFSYKEEYKYYISSRDWSCFWPFNYGINGMITLREGDFYEISPDTGLRAVEITRERDYRALPITPEDIKYLVEIDNSQYQIDCMILKGPEMKK